MITVKGEKVPAVLIVLPCYINSHVSQDKQKPIFLACAIAENLKNVKCLLSLDDYRILKQAETETTKSLILENKLPYAVPVIADETISPTPIYDDYSCGLVDLDIDWEAYGDIKAENLLSFSDEEDNYFVEMNNVPDDADDEHVYALGIVFEDDEDFGDIKFYDRKLEEEHLSIERIKQLELNHLSENRQRELKSVLVKYHKIFSDTPGHCNVIKHEIRLKPDFIPKPRRPYRIPENLKKEVNRQIEELLVQGKIRPSKSNYAHPIVCVVKKQGDIRLCCDFRDVNSGTIPDAYPMPLIDELLNKISPANFITSLDCTSGYWQIELEEKSIERTAFITDSGLYEWLVLPFGVRSASSTYQRAMNLILKTHKDYACSYIDDASVFSVTWDDHLGHLDRVLHSIEQAGLTLRLSKCAFAQPQIKFLGHVVGSGEIKVLPEKLEALKAIQPPTSKKLVRSVLGMFGFFRNFIPNFAAIATPLTEMIKGRASKTFVLNEKQKAAFENLKAELCSDRVLTPPDYTKPFKIYKDSSEYAVGACLIQEHDGKEKPIAFASNKLTDIQRRWSVIEKESYAVIFALRKFDKHVFGSQIDLYTDHNTLRYLVLTAPNSAKLTRWALALQRYNITVHHYAGKLNRVADYLSRA